MIKLFELLNDPQILLLEPNKRVEQFLTPEQLGLLKEVTPAYDKKGIKDTLRRVMEVFPETERLVKNKYSYNYHEGLEDKVRPKVLELLNDS